jgi:hypothetical protein
VPTRGQRHEARSDRLKRGWKEKQLASNINIDQEPKVQKITIGQIKSYRILIDF